MLGVAPPLETLGKVAVTLVTVPCGCAVQPTTPMLFVVSALVPLQLEAPPIRERLVLVALIARKLLVLCAVDEAKVVVP